MAVFSEEMEVKGREEGAELVGLWVGLCVFTRLLTGHQLRGRDMEGPWQGS